MMAASVLSVSLIPGLPPLFPVHPEQLPQRPWITLKERDQMIPTGKLSNRKT